MIPVNSNIKSKNCPDPISSSCVVYDGGALDCINICKGSPLTPVIEQIGKIVCDSLKGVDVSSLDLGCLYSATVTTWSCPGVGLTFLPDTTAPNGAGYCQGCCPPYISTTIPISITVTNPVPPPTTVLGVLQLMINAIPCCDPCAKGVNVGFPP